MPNLRLMDITLAKTGGETLREHSDKVVVITSRLLRVLPEPVSARFNDQYGTHSQQLLTWLCAFFHDVGKTWTHRGQKPYYGPSHAIEGARGLLRALLSRGVDRLLAERLAMTVASHHGQPDYTSVVHRCPNQIVVDCCDEEWAGLPIKPDHFGGSVNPESNELSLSAAAGVIALADWLASSSSSLGYEFALPIKVVLDPDSIPLGGDRLLQAFFKREVSLRPADVYDWGGVTERDGRVYLCRLLLAIGGHELPPPRWNRS